MMEQNTLEAAVLAIRSEQRLLGAGDLDGAISQFRTAIGAAPDNAMAHFQWGLALQRKRDPAATAQEFENAYPLTAP